MSCTLAMAECNDMRYIGGARTHFMSVPNCSRSLSM